MNFILWIVFGALAGWMASMFMKTDERQGALLNIVVGIVGAIIGGLIMNFFGQSGVTGFNIYSLVVAVIGSAVFIAILKALA